jgi:predicted Holliday junction resolvase-like endonuclease
MILQIADPQVTQTFLEYGLLGALVVVLFFVVRYLYLQVKETSETWKEMALKNQDSFIELSTKQNETNKRLIDIREKDISENTDFRKEVKKRMEDLPDEVAEKVLLKQINNGKSNYTPNV